MKLPAKSPDLDPIENLWHIIGDIVRKEQPSTVTDLWNKMKQEWKKISPKLCKKLMRFSFENIFRNQNRSLIQLYIYRLYNCNACSLLSELKYVLTFKLVCK